MEFNEENYRSMLEELFSRHPSVQKDGFTPGSYKPGLDGMREFDRRLGSPWKKYKCIHVAGTNGKGGMCSMIAGALSARHSVGLYTSPHLLDFRERMKIVHDGSSEMISEREVWDFAQSHDLEGLSFFEITTAMALDWFARCGVEYAVIETGLGGRLDSTNIITPAVCVITSIGLDHCALLGNTITEIAGEKAGIIKPGVPVFTVMKNAEADAVISRRAAELGAPRLYGTEYGSGTITGTVSCDIRITGCRKYARTALSVCLLLGESIDETLKDALRHAGRITGFRGRWEKLSANPLTICDIGHNPQALSANFRKLKASRRELFIVFGIMADKDLEGELKFMPRSAEWFLAAPAIPRAMPADVLCGRMHGIDRKTVCASVAEAVEKASEKALHFQETAGRKATVFIGGSSFVVAEALAAPYLSESAK